MTHLVLHIALCAALSKTPPDTSIPFHVKLADRREIVRAEQTFKVDRGYDDTKVVEFDAPQGTYRLDVSSGKYGCAASTFVELLDNHGRTIDVPLPNTPERTPVPVLLDGTAPASFLYVAPTFVLLPKDAACNAPVPQPLPSNIKLENDQDAFYAWLYEEPPYDAPATLALRLKTPTHQYHYVRLPIPYPIPQGGWPSNIQMDVTENMVDSLAGEPVGTLLCPHLWQTKVYY